MPIDKTDNNNYGRQSEEAGRDLGATGGPATGLGTADGKHSVSHPYNSDLQTQIAAKGKGKTENQKDKNKSSL